MILHTASQVCWTLALVLTAVYAMWRGGRPERLAISACLAADFASVFLQRPHAWAQPEIGLLVVDALLTLTLAAIMVRARRWWPVAAFAFQALSVGMPLMRMVDPALPPMGYYVGGLVWNYIGLLILALGVRLEGCARDPAPNAELSGS